MIEISLKTDGQDLVTEYDEDNPTLKEVALIIYKLEEIKLELMAKEFQDKIRIDGDEGEDDE